MNQLPLRPPPPDPWIAGLLDMACAPPLPPSSAATIVLPTDVSATAKIVRWANRTAYLDDDDSTQKYPTLEAFVAQAGQLITMPNAPVRARPCCRSRCPSTTSSSRPSSPATGQRSQSSSSGPTCAAFPPHPSPLSPSPEEHS